MLDSLGGRSTLVTEVTRETRQSEVVPLTDLRIRDTRSSTQPADRRASASWSQHSSMVTQSWARPCTTAGKRKKTPLLVALSEDKQTGDVSEDQAEPTGPPAGNWGGAPRPAVTILSSTASFTASDTESKGNPGPSWGEHDCLLFENCRAAIFKLNLRRSPYHTRAQSTVTVGTEEGCIPQPRIPPQSPGTKLDTMCWNQL